MQEDNVSVAGEWRLDQAVSICLIEGTSWKPSTRMRCAKSTKNGNDKCGKKFDCSEGEKVIDGQADKIVNSLLLNTQKKGTYY